MTLLRALLLVSLSLVSAKLIAGEVRPVAAPALGAMPGIAFPASVAFGPDGGVAVWRVGFGQIWGVALDGAGRPISPARMVVDDPDGTNGPAVQYAPHGFSLWWHQLSGTKRARMDRDSLRVSDVRPLDGVLEPLASVPAGTLVRSTRYDRPTTILFLDSQGTPVQEWTLPEIGPINVAKAVVMADGTFALATSGWDGLHLTRVSAEGGKLGAPVAIELAEGTTAPDYRPHLASLANDGAAVLIAAVAGEHQQKPDLKTYRVERDDSVSARHTIVAGRWSTIREVELLTGPGGFTVVISAGDRNAANAEHLDLFAARLDRRGEVEGEFVSIFTSTDVAEALTSAAVGDRHLVFFQDGAFGAATLFSMVLPDRGPISRPNPALIARVSESRAWQLGPDAASDGTGWLTVWLERLADREEIRAIVLGADGAPAGPAVTVRSIFRYLGSPSVVFDGLDYVVSWNEGASLFAQRVTRDGALLGETPALVSNRAGGSVSTAARTGTTMFAWGSPEIEVAVMRPDGTVSDPRRISPPSRWENDEHVAYERPVLAAGEESFLVAWMETRWLDCGMIITCPTTGHAQARLVSDLGIPRFGQLELDTGVPAFAAGTGGTFLLMSGGRRGTLIDESSAQMTDLQITNGPFLPFEHFGVNGEYIIPYSDAAYAPLRIRRYSAEGQLLAQQTVDAVAPPRAASPQGSLLVVASQRVLETPWNGAPAIVSQMLDTFLRYAPPARQRSAGR